MKHIQLLLFLLFINFTIHAQFSKSFDSAEEYKLSNNLWTENEMLNYDKSVMIMDSILQLTNSPDYFILTMGLTASIDTQNKKMTEKILDIASINSYKMHRYQSQVKDIYPELSEKYHDLFVKNQSKIEDFSLAQRLAQMFVDDQVCLSQFYMNNVINARQLGFNVIINENNNCEELFPQNTAELQSLLIQQPELSKSQVGYWAMGAIFAIIQHSEESDFLAFEPYMKKWYENDDIDPSNYALYVDRYNKYKGIPQIYGSQFTTKSGELIFEPIKGIESINERRMKMGLESIERYAAAAKINWNEYVSKIKNGQKQ